MTFDVKSDVNFDVAGIQTGRGMASYRQLAPKIESSQLPIVLIHGWPESSYSWTAVASALAALRPGARVIAPDLRGMGDAPRGGQPGDYCKDQLALDVLALLDALHMPRAVIVGHDWGGIVAQEIALAAPDRVAALGIANIAVINNLETNRRIARTSQNRFMWYQHFLQTELAEALIPGNEAPWVRYFLRAWRPEGFPQAVIDEVIRYHRIPGTAQATANYYRVYGKDIARWNALSSYRFPMPSLYLHGVHDVVITPDYLDGVEACFDTLEIARIEAGHFVQDEQPQQFAALLHAWLSRVQ